MKKIIALIASILFIGGAYAADLTTVPRNISAGDESVLRKWVSASQTTIQIEPLNKYVNGVKTQGCFDTSAGFAVIQDISRTEWISYGSKSCNSTTNVTTLSSVRRGLSPTSPSFAAGTGMTWDAGSSIRIIDYPVVYSHTMYIDSPNNISGSGSINCTSSTQPCINLRGHTTTQRDSFTYKQSGAIIRNTTLGALQWYDGSTWLSLAVQTGSFINGSDTIAGKFQAAKFAALENLTETGSTGALNVLTPRLVIKNGSGAISANRILMSNSSGVLAASLGGLGRQKPISGSVMIAQGSNPVKLVRPTSAGQLLVSNDGVNASFSTLTVPPTAIYSTFTPKYTMDDGAATGYLLNLTITGGTVNPGQTLKFRMSGTGSASSGNISLNLYVGTGNLVALNSGSIGTKNPWFLEGEITFLTVGTNAKYIIRTQTIGMGAATLTQSAPITVKFQTTTSDFNIRLGASRVGANSVSATLYQAIVERFN